MYPRSSASVGRRARGSLVGRGVEGRGEGAGWEPAEAAKTMAGQAGGARGGAGSTDV
jgi:hypothetical protein